MFSLKNDKVWCPHSQFIEGSIELLQEWKLVAYIFFQTTGATISPTNSCCQYEVMALQTHFRLKTQAPEISPNLY